MAEVSNTGGWIRVVRPAITLPSLKDNTADVDRIIKALERELEGESVIMDFSFIKEIPSFLGRHGYEMSAVLFKEHRAWKVMDILPQEWEGPLYGLAMDLGSATIVVRLLDLNTRREVEEISFINPQMEIGPDILTRIHFAVVASMDSADRSDLTISQSDIDALLRSKAAMYTILTTITHMIHLSIKDIRHIYISGTFGSFIDPKSAITIGMLPDLPLETYRPMGNTSLSGAELALLSEEARDEIYRIRDRVTYIELNVNQDFMNLFSAARFIPHTDRSLFPSVKERSSTIYRTV